MWINLHLVQIATSGVLQLSPWAGYLHVTQLTLVSTTLRLSGCNVRVSLRNGVSFDSAPLSAWRGTSGTAWHAWGIRLEQRERGNNET